MSSIMGIDTAIGFAHWHLRGGWKRTLVITGCFIAGIVGLMILTMQLRSPYPGSEQVVWAGWRIGLLLLQAGLLVLFTASRVAVAIRSDITSRMLESHQLMPIAPLTAISGYLWGATAPTLVVAVANFVLGLLATVGAGMDPRVWLGPNLMLLIFAVFTWVLAAFCGFFSRSAWAGIFGLLIVTGFSQGALIFVLPALGILAGPTIGMTIFTPRIRSYEFDWTVFVSVGAQVLTGVIFYIGAARKYRSNEDPALGVVPANLLLMLWTALSAIGLYWNEDFRNPMFGPDNLDRSIAPLVISTTFLMLIGITPVANAARDRRLTHYSPLIALLSTAIIIVLPLVILARHTLVEICFTAFILMASLLSLCYLLRILYRATKQAWMIAACWIGIAWCAPLIIDLVVWTIRNPDQTFEMGTLSSASPVGGFIMVWNGQSHMATGGVIVQLLLAIFWMALFHGTQRRPHARTIHQTG